MSSCCNRTYMNGHLKYPCIFMVLILYFKDFKVGKETLVCIGIKYIKDNKTIVYNKIRMSTQFWKLCGKCFFFLSNYHFCSKNINFVCFGNFWFISFHFLAASWNVDLAATDYLLKMNEWIDNALRKFWNFYFISAISVKETSEKNCFLSILLCLTVVTNDHKLSILQLFRSEMLNGSCWVLAGVIPFSRL